MTIPDAIRTIYDHYLMGRVSERFLASTIVEYVSREAARDEAIDHAGALISALRETQGAPPGKLWAKASVRVYFPGDLGYLTVGRDGTLQGAVAITGRRGQSITFDVHALHRGARRAYQQAVTTYLAGVAARGEEHEQDRVAQVDALRKACGLDAFDDGCDVP